MKIHAMNEIQSHYEQVKQEVIRRGEVTLRGYQVKGVVQLLEGSNRIAAAVELGLPVTILIPDDNEIIEHDDDGTFSKVTGATDRATVLELAASIALDPNRGNFAVYDTADHPNIRIADMTKPG